MQTPLPKLNVLVYNWHEPYICLFAHTGHAFFVAPPKQHPQKNWNRGFRPLPENVTELTSAQAEVGLRAGRFELLICLTLQDVHAVQDLKLPRLFVMLNMIGTDVGLEGARKEEYVAGLKAHFEEIEIAFISEKKRADWGWDAPVVVSGIDPADYGDFNGELPRVLRVGNMLKERDHMQGFGIQEEILGDRFSSLIVGVNPSVRTSRPSRSWDDLKDQFRQHRLLLNTLTDRHEDGYNLAMLEAMATGMPVVSIDNSSSPIVDGFNGFVSDDIEHLRQKIQLLLSDRALAAELGRNGRRTVEERFHIERCATQWNELFQQCVAGRHPDAAKPARLSQSVADTVPSGNRLKILLAAPSNPLTTSAYYERALRRSHDVLTCGPKLDEKTMGQWKQWEDQHAFKPAGVGDADKMGLLLRLARSCDVPLPWGKVSASEVLAALPSEWKPDLVIWIDAGPEFQITNPQDFGCATACLIGDLHTGQSNWRIEYARQFQHAFVMFNRDHVAQLTAAGCNAGWLPAACEPEIHRSFDVPKAYDVVFVGQTMPAWHKDRVRLLERLKEGGFDLRVDSKILEEMALLFSRGRLVFNRSLNGDLNMRVFEAMACGSLLITDRLPDAAGLEELFEDRRHLVLYDEEDLETLVAHYLKNEDEREEIAARGRTEVLAHHTYGHRADQLLTQVFGAHAVASCAASPRQAPAENSVATAPATRPELPAYYQNQRPEIVALIPPSSMRVLDVGCAAGEMGRLLKSQRPGVHIVGIEKETRAATRARSNLDEVIGADMDELETLPYPVEHFDCITCGDILEHLRDPEAVVKKLLPYLKQGGSLVCSIPNIRHQSVLLDLLVNGRWQYRDEGLLDRTHIHFFTLAEIQAMMQRLGLKIARMSASQSPVESSMEPILKAVGALGGDAEGARHESRIMQYIFQATRAAAPLQATIVMPVYNQAEHTERCLHALAANDEAEPSYELVVVDNASTDWTPYLLNSFEGDVQVLSNDTNLGFARACNQGAEAAQGNYVVFLNNDTLPHPGWLKAMVQVAESDPMVGIVGAKLLYPETEKVQHAGLALRNGVPEHLHRGVNYRDPRVESRCEIDMVTGACMLVRKELFAELGGFDEAYLNGVEDVDFCLRVRERGFKVVYCPQAVLDHWEGSSDGRFDSVNANLQRFKDKWGDRFDSEGRLTGPAAAATTVLRGNVEGSFFLPSSLSHVNRELLREILETGDLEIGVVPFEEDSPTAATSRFRAVAERFGRMVSDADFHLRHHWPPNFARPESGKLVLMQHWEFGRIPSAWIAPIRANVDQIWTATNYVRDCYVDSGIAPENVAVVPLGVDVERFNPQTKPMSLMTRKSFKFLFVGGTLYRKGIDLLLRAYRSAFSRDDDVCLVIKDMGTNTFYRNQHAGEAIRAFQQDPSSPEILYLTEDLQDDEVSSLYAACDCLVHPYRGEGFGLPVAEAMACALPTIVTAGGACDDFCDGETSFLVPATRQDIQFEQPTAGQAWLLEPDSAVLEAHMRTVFQYPDQARGRGLLAARKIAASFTWKHAARTAVDTLQELCRSDVAKNGRRFDAGEGSGASAVEASPAVDAPNGQEEDHGGPVGIRLAVIVLGGDGTEDVSGFVPPGVEIERYDVEIAQGLKFGEQLNAIYRHSTCDIIAAVSIDSCPVGAMGNRLIEHLKAESTCAMIGPGNGSASNGHALEQVEYLEPNLVVMRRAAIESVLGVDSAFHTLAAIDDLARCCRRQGWSVLKDNGALNPLEGSSGQGDVLLLREQAAVHEIERGDKLKDVGDLGGALAAYDSALEKKENFVEAIIVRASILVERGEPEVAVGSLERLVRIDPDSARAWNYLGLVQYQSEQWEKSSVSFEKALNLDSNSVEVLINLAVLQWEQGAANDALDNLERAAAIEPSNRDVIINTALIHAQVGNASAAIKLVQRYSDHNPSDLDAKVVHGELLLEGGEGAKARELALEVLAAQPGHERALCLLESLGGQKEQKSEG